MCLVQQVAIVLLTAALVDVTLADVKRPPDTAADNEADAQRPPVTNVAADVNAGEGMNKERSSESGPTEVESEEEEPPAELSPLPGTEIFPDGLIQLCMCV